jgi:hypothetical protein
MAFWKENESNNLQDVEYICFISLFTFIKMIPNIRPFLKLNTRTDTGKPSDVHYTCHWLHFMASSVT